MEKLTDEALQTLQQQASLLFVEHSDAYAAAKQSKNAKKAEAARKNLAFSQSICTCLKELENRRKIAREMKGYLEEIFF